MFSLIKISAGSSTADARLSCRPETTDWAMAATALRQTVSQLA